jgi:hypothetical protein
MSGHLSSGTTAPITGACLAGYKPHSSATRFIARQRITRVETKVDDPLRLLVAASAAALSVGWPGYKWSELSEVLLYPDSFDRDYRFGQPELAGQAHVWGTVILSVPSLRHSFAHDEDPYHVGMHECAHLLTYERGQQIKVPVGLPAAQIQLWEVIQADELERIAGGTSIVSPVCAAALGVLSVRRRSILSEAHRAQRNASKTLRGSQPVFPPESRLVGVQVSRSFSRLNVALRRHRRADAPSQLKLERLSPASSKRTLPWLCEKPSTCRRRDGV